MTPAETNSQDVLRGEIIADARRQAERVTRRAQADATAVLKKAKDEAEKARRERTEAAHAEAKRRRDLALATVPVQVARMRAARIEAALQAIRDEARRRLVSRENVDPRRTIVDLAVEAIPRMDGNRFVLEVSEADRQAFGDSPADEVRGRLGRGDLEIAMATGSDPVAAGVRIRDDVGRQVWDNSLLGRLERLWPAMRPQIAAQAFPSLRSTPGKES